MQEIVKQYGDAILIGFVGFFLLVMLFFAWPSDDGTFLGSVGEQVEQSVDRRVVDWGSQKDGTALNTHAKRNKPTAKTKKHAVEKQMISVTDLFLLTDHDGRTWVSTEKVWKKNGGDTKTGVVDILSIKNSSGQELVDQTYDGIPVWNRDTQMLRFPEPDTCLVKLRVMDYDNVEATYEIPVAVDMEYPNK